LPFCIAGSGEKGNRFFVDEFKKTVDYSVELYYFIIKSNYIVKLNREGKYET